MNERSIILSFYRLAQESTIPFKHGAKKPVKQETDALTAAMLAERPPELRQALDETTLVANRKASLEVIDRIAEQASETAAHLRTLVQNFEIERIRELLAEGG